MIEVMAAEPSIIRDEHIVQMDAVWLQREQEMDDGSFIVRCLKGNCYRLRDLSRCGAGKDGVYIVFEVDPEVYKNTFEPSYGSLSCPSTN